MSRCVSEALQIELGHPFESKLREAIAAIDRVHRDGELEITPVISENDSTRLGDYDGSRISISTSNPVPRLTLLHEVGHLLESMVTEFRMEWWRVTRRSRGVQSHFRRCVTEGLEIAPEVAARIEYLTEESEMWARSYAQFVVTESGCNLLRTELENRRSVCRDHWEDSDFEAIRMALLQLLERKGWQP